MSDRTDGPWTGNNDIVVTYRGHQIMKDGGLCHCYDCTKKERDAIDKKIELEPAFQIAKAMLSEPSQMRSILKTEAL